MNKSIPQPAGLILDLIGSKEAPHGYDTVYGNKMSSMVKQITSMTVSEVIANGPWRTKNLGSSAAGRYQFMTATLQQLMTDHHLTGHEIMTPDFQDALGYALLVKRMYADFISGRIGRTAFGDYLSMEWASFPVLSVERKGAHRTVRRGETYYEGDKLNRALIKPETVEYVLDQAKLMAQAPKPLDEAPSHAPTAPAAVPTSTTAGTRPPGISPKPTAPVVILAPPSVSPPPVSTVPTAPPSPASPWEAFLAFLKALFGRS